MVDLAAPVNDRVKLKESTNKRYVPGRCSGIKKAVEHESDGDTNCNWCSWYSHQKISKGTGRRENKWTSGDHPNSSIVEIVENSKKSPKDLGRLAVTHTPVEN